MKALVLGGTGLCRALRAGPANTLDWYLRSGAAAVDDALSDPLRNRTCDFGYEAEVAARVRNRLLRKDA